MGRKIPAKKHKGVKDPLKQQAQRFQKLKTKINAPPTDPDEQPVPRTLTRLFAFQDRPAEKDSRKKKNKTSIDVTDSGGRAGRAGRNPVARLSRLPGEAARAFSRRINSAVRQISEPEDLMDYPVDIEEDDVKGERMLAERERRQQKRRKKEKEARIARGEPRRGPAAEPEPPRPHRMDLKKAARKAKAAEVMATRAEVQYERVAFGEVSAAPPALPPPRRAAPAAGAARPGRRDLLLCSLLGAGGSPAAPAAPTAPTAPALQRERQERARQAAVDAYRALKLEKAKSKNKPTRYVAR